MTEQKNRFQIATEWINDSMPKLLDDDETQIIITIRDALTLAQDAERLRAVCASAAICLLEPNYTIPDTIWFDSACTLYEHLVCDLPVELTGDIEHDIVELKKLTIYNESDSKMGDE